MASWSQVETVFKRFAAADVYVINTPLWNNGIPYALKQFIDLVTQPGWTFGFDPASGYKGLMTGKHLAWSLAGLDLTLGRGKGITMYQDPAYGEVDRLSVSFDGTPVFLRGEPTGHAPDLGGAAVSIDLDLGLGSGLASYLASDLTYDYVRLNAEYTT